MTDMGGTVAAATAAGAGHDIAVWSDFGVGVMGAGAALSGLLFVAVSINLQRIPAYPGLLVEIQR